MPHLPSSPHLNQSGKAQQGVTLLEMALAMMILSVLSVGVSSILRTGVESQMAQRNDLTMQSIGMDISEDLRNDIRLADSASIGGGGNSMTLVVGNSNANTTYNVTYSLDGSGQLTRQANGQSKIYNDQTIYKTPILVVQCTNGCFTAMQMNNDTPQSPREVLVNEMIVTQSTSQNTLIDRSFNRLANFPLRAFSFNLTGATQFQ
jgi:prepilin-type N-terminal cleavage/methylation domain-containing protein